MREPQRGDTIAVWFSCGAASAVAAKKTIEKYGDICNIRVINNPVVEEDADNQRFLKDVEKWLGVTIESAINSKFKSCSCADAWEEAGQMGNLYGASCTTYLKKHARYEWEIKNRPDWTVLGFTKEEKNRFDKFIARERPNSIHILKDIPKYECFNIIQEAGIKLPRIYLLGYPNANCIGCVKATSPTYWNHVRKVHPEVFQERAEQSRGYGAKLVRVKNKRIFLDELDPMAQGKPMKDMNFECGIFCMKD